MGNMNGRRRGSGLGLLHQIELLLEAPVDLIKGRSAGRVPVPALEHQLRPALAGFRRPLVPVRCDPLL